MIPAQTTLVPARDGRAGPALDGLTLAEVRERALTLWRWTAARYLAGRSHPGGQ